MSEKSKVTAHAICFKVTPGSVLSDDFKEQVREITRVTVFGDINAAKAKQNGHPVSREDMMQFETMMSRLNRIVKIELANHVEKCLDELIVDGPEAVRSEMIKKYYDPSHEE